MLRDLLTSGWLWITIFGCIVVGLGPYFFLIVFLQVPSPYSGITIMFITVAWGIAAGYKDWRLYKRKQKERVPGYERTRSTDNPT
jgi:hypothetical protein